MNVLSSSRTRRFCLASATLLAAATCALLATASSALPSAAATPSDRPSRAVGAATTYEVLRGESELIVRTFSDRSAPLAHLAHDHVIRATDVSGRLQLDREKPEACRGRLEVSVAKLAVDEAKLRRRFSLAPLEEGDRVEVRENMLARDQLDSKAHPKIAFLLRGCRRRGPRAFEARLSILVKGRKATIPSPVRFQLESNGSSPLIRSQSKLRTSHRALGLEPYSAFFGAVRNASPLDFLWRIRARPRREPAATAE